MANPKDIRQKVEIDTGDSVKEIRQVADAAEDTDKAIEEVDDREITVDADQALKRLSEIKAEAKALADEKVAITAELDSAGLRTALDKVKSDLDAIDTSLEVGVDVDHGRVNATTTAVNDVFSELGASGASTAIGISQAFNDAAEQAVAAFGPESGIAQALGALGPIGTAALGAAVGGVLYWWQQIKAEQEAAKAKVAEYVDALEEAQGAVSEVALTKALENLQDPDVVKAINKIGLSWTDVASIIQGDAVPAWDRLKEVQEFLDRTGVRGSRSNYVRALRDEFDVTTQVAEEMLDQHLALGDSVRKIDEDLAKEESGLRNSIEAYKNRQEIVERTIEQNGGLKASYESLPEEVITKITPYLSPEGRKILEQIEAAAEERRALVTSGASTSGGTTNITNNYPPGNDGREVDRAYQDYWRSNGRVTWQGN